MSAEGLQSGFDDSRLPAASFSEGQPAPADLLVMLRERSLPGEQVPTHAQQWQRQLGQDGEGGTGTSRDDLVRLAMQRIVTKGDLHG